MKKYKALYKGMYDDLKDAEMMIKYAYEIKEHEEDEHLANELAKYAQYRLEHFLDFHKIFESEVEKEKEEKETVAHCMWKETHKMMQEWYAKIKHKIEKY